MAEHGKSRGSNFSTAELNQLSASWCHVSQDPIVGSSQSLKSFWSRTLQHYNANKPSDREVRGIRSLDSKWSELKHDVAKFVGCYQAVLDKNCSGEGLEDTLRKAKELYVVKDPKNQEFKYIEQWTLLKNCPRFQLTVDDMSQKLSQAKARKQKGKGRFSNEKENDSPNVEGVIDLETEADSVADMPISNCASESAHFGEERPIGNKVAKRLRGDDSATKIMATAQRDMASISAKRLKLAEKRDLESLLTLRVADIDEECQQYFKACRAKELRIAMAKLQKEEEDEMRALRGSRRSPMPYNPHPEMSPPIDTTHEGAPDQSPGLGVTDVPISTRNEEAPSANPGLGVTLAEQLLALDGEMGEGINRFSQF